MKTTDTLLTLRVADIMTKSATTVSANQTMTEAAALFQNSEISSAPMVDDRGHCVGILSAADFVRREFDYSQDDRCLPGGDEPRWVPASGNSPGRFVPQHEDFVEFHMTAAVQSIDKSASLVAAARMMCAGHIHHLIVVDDLNHPSGVVSSLDIVAAVSNVIDAEQAHIDRQRAKT